MTDQPEGAPCHCHGCGAVIRYRDVPRDEETPLCWQCGKDEEAA
jgi:hypothetical protein